MTKAVFEALAIRCETEAPSRKLDAAIARATGFFTVFAEPNGHFGIVKGIRLSGRDPSPFAYSMTAPWWPPGAIHRNPENDDDVAEVLGATLPSYSTSFDAARSITNWILVLCSDIHADGLSLVDLADTSALLVKSAIGIGGRNLALTLSAAGLRALAQELPDA